MNGQPQEGESAQILVVDDSLLMRTLVQEKLLKAGFRVITAVDGLEAWERLQKEPVHVIVADVKMPRLDGLELTRMIRADKQLGALPVILMSAIDAHEDRRSGLICGANDFVVKDRQDLESLPDKIIDLLASA